MLNAGAAHPAATLLAHTGPLWGVDPLVVVSLLALCGAYLWGRRRLLREAPASALGTRQRLRWFAAAVAVLAVAVGPPLDPLSAQLFSAHMVQHLLLALVAPVLVVLAAPLQVGGFLLRPSTRHRTVRSVHRVARTTGLRVGSLRLGAVASVLFVANMYFWHIPPVYDAAVRHEIVHAIEHLTLLSTGVFMVWAVVGVGRRTRSAGATLQMFTIALAMGALAATITLAPEPLYSSHLLFTHEWGLTPLQDQQLAGAVMWVPGGILVMGLALSTFVRWLGEGPAPGQSTVEAFELPPVQTPLESEAT